jgi:hypothetical protein
MSRKPAFTLIWIAILLFGLVFTAVPSRAVSAASGPTKLDQLDKIFSTQVKELAYQKDLLNAVLARLDEVKDIQGGYQKTDFAYNSIQWKLNHAQWDIATARDALAQADKLLASHRGYEFSSSGLTSISNKNLAELSINALAGQVAASGTSLRRAMRVLKSLIEDYGG